MVTEPVGSHSEGEDQSTILHRSINLMQLKARLSNWLNYNNTLPAQEIMLLLTLFLKQLWK